MMLLLLCPPQIELSDRGGPISLGRGYLTVGDVASLAPSKTEITFYVTTATPPLPPPQQNAFSMMMGQARENSHYTSLPDRIANTITGIDALVNELIDLATENGAGFRGDEANTVGGKLFREIASKIFFPLTHFEKQLFEHAAPARCRPPEEFKRFCGFSAAAAGTSKKKKPVLDQQVCNVVIHSIRSISFEYPELKNGRWSGLKKLLNDLETAMARRQEYLKTEATARAERVHVDEQGQLQHRDNAAGLVVVSYEAVRPSVQLKLEYERLNSAVQCLADYETLSLLDFMPKQDTYAGKNFSVIKGRWIENLMLRKRCFLVKISQGGPYDNLYWIFPVPPNEVRSFLFHYHSVYSYIN